MKASSRIRLLVTTAALVAGALAPLGCKKATPVAPTGATLTISADPSRITSASGGTSTITAIVTREGGTPVNTGTIVFFNTTLGTIDAQGKTDSSGVARATLHGNGQIGTAKVTASSGAIAPQEIDVQIGGQPVQISLQASPATVSTDGGDVSLTALARDDQGLPLVGAQLAFTSPFGTLSKGSFVATGNDGSATDSLHLTAADVAAISSGSFQVTVSGGGSSAVTATATINVLRLIPAFQFTQVSGTLTVIFTDQTSPKPISWLWDFGDGSTSTIENPAHTYGAAKTYAVTLTVTTGLGTTSISEPVPVTSVTTGG